MRYSQALLARLQLSEEELKIKLTREVRQVFSTMLGIDNLPYLPLPDDPMEHSGDCISALVGIAGSYEGLVSLHVPRNFAMKLTSNLLDQEIKEYGEEVGDAVGELANIFADTFKNLLDQRGTEVRISIPSVVTGEQWTAQVTMEPDVTALLFGSKEDWFLLAMALKDLTDPKGKRAVRNVPGMHAPVVPQPYW